MTDRKLKTVRPRLEALVAQDRDLLKALVKEALDQLLQAERRSFWVRRRANAVVSDWATAPVTTSAD